MGWEKGRRYYTRSRKVQGRVVREYVGKGVAAELAARLDALRRRLREEERAAQRAQRVLLEALDAQREPWEEVADLVARAALVAAGYHQHRRGEWRRRRAPRNPHA